MHWNLTPQEIILPLRQFCPSGSDNTAIGGSALASNTTANGNIAIGRICLHKILPRNVCIGNFVADVQTTGNDNVAMGHVAFSANTTFIPPLLVPSTSS